jgi:hypothetical protein
MFDRDGQLYLHDRKKGLLVFDYYGAKKNVYQLFNVLDVQVIDKNTITARDTSSLILYKPSTLQLSKFSAFTDQSQFTKITFNSNRVYALNNKGEVEIYLVEK